MHAPEGAEILRREQLEMKAGSPIREPSAQMPEIFLKKL